MADRSSDERWGWDLKRQRPVLWDERGPSDTVLGPYPSRSAAEHWRERIEDRNTDWNDADDEWRGDTRRDAPGDGD